MPSYARRLAIPASVSPEATVYSAAPGCDGAGAGFAGGAGGATGFALGAGRGSGRATTVGAGLAAGVGSYNFV